MDTNRCRLCPNQCGVDRRVAVGACRVGEAALVARIALHPWEEPPISGTRGSGTVFFSGCSLSCVFCQNEEISHRAAGRVYSIDELGRAICELVEAGAHNINLVNPTHYAHLLPPLLEKYRPPVPVVYNTGGYDSVESLRELRGLIDIYLPDLKYLSPALSLRYSGHEDYPARATAALDEMFAQVGPYRLDENGLLTSGMLVRHLVLPGQSGEAVRVMEYLATRYGRDILVSAMSQYTPHARACDFPEINRRLRPIEYKRVVAAMRRLGMDNAFTQELDSSDEAYIPPFDLT